MLDKPTPQPDSDEMLMQVQTSSDNDFDLAAGHVVLSIHRKTLSLAAAQAVQHFGWGTCGQIAIPV